jgi:uncharacterized protein
MMVWRRAHVELIACVLTAGVAIGAVGAANSEGGWVPKLTGRVNDTANVLSSVDRDRISEILRSYERETHHQIVVLTIATLGDEKIEAFSLRTCNAWGIGQKAVDDGICVTLAMKERRVRVELGKGMERFISDADAKAIIDTEMTPAFAKGDYFGGLERGLKRLMEDGRRFVVHAEAGPTPSN